MCGNSGERGRTRVYGKDVGRLAIRIVLLATTMQCPTDCDRHSCSSDSLLFNTHTRATIELHQRGGSLLVVSSSERDSANPRFENIAQLDTHADLFSTVENAQEE
jgi:hypothetical protein